MNNKNRIFVFFAGLLLFGCASQSPSNVPVDNQPTTAHYCPQTQEEMNLFLKGCNKQ